MITKDLRKVATKTVSINTDYTTAFDYITNPMNQKEWAVNFIKDVKETDSGYIATVPFGEIPIEFYSDIKTGIIDIVLGKGEPIHTRLIKNKEGCEYIFTIFQPGDMPDVIWENEGIPSLIKELQILKAILEKKM